MFECVRAIEMKYTVRERTLLCTFLFPDYLSVEGTQHIWIKIVCNVLACDICSLRAMLLNVSADSDKIVRCRLFDQINETIETHTLNKTHEHMRR